MSSQDFFWPKFVELPLEAPEHYFPVGVWTRDVLGAGFESRTFQLPRDEEGELPITLVRHCPNQDPSAIPGTPAEASFTFLYLHGWNDYFFQRELARHISRAGGRFYALDLSKYGRSWRPWQTFGWSDNLIGYDLDLALASEFIKDDNPGLPFVLCGHSTGGLIAAAWAVRNRDQLDGLVLNSPWVEMPKGGLQRRMATTAGLLYGYKRRRAVAPLKNENDSAYGDSLAGWAAEFDGDLPQSLEKWQKDPSISGFNLVPEWKGTENAKVRVGWLRAISVAQNSLLQAKPLTCPLFFSTSTDSYFGPRGRQNMYADSVLNVERLCSVAWRLGTNISMQRIPGKHDPLLSFPPQRQAYWRQLHEWLSLSVSGVALPDFAVNAICP